MGPTIVANGYAIFGHGCCFGSCCESYLTARQQAGILVLEFNKHARGADAIS